MLCDISRFSEWVNIALRHFLHNQGNIATEWSPKPKLCPTLISNDFNGFFIMFIVHSTIGSTVHSIPLNSLEHCRCAITMTNIRPDLDSNLYHTSRLQAPIDTNEPSGPCISRLKPIINMYVPVAYPSKQGISKTPSIPSTPSPLDPRPSTHDRRPSTSFLKSFCLFI